MNAYIDIYCERLAPGLWAEPLNAATNLAFVASALLLGWLLLAGPASPRRDPVPWALAGLVLVIGIGSGLFHTFARRWAMLADVIPIAILILAYVWFAIRRFAGGSALAAGLGVAAVLATAVLVPPLTGFRGGSYVAALLAMVVIGGWLVRARRHPAGRTLLGAAALFAVSLAFRTADAPLCAVFPAGTHFVWHLLNATVLFLVVRAMIRHGARGAAGPRVSAPPSPASGSGSP
jgi:hypothetical protein